MFDGVMAGRLVRPAKMSQTRTGKAMATALVAVRCEQTSDTTLVSCVAFERFAEQLGAMEKGDAITAVGPIRPTQWETGDGETRHGIGMTIAKLTTPYLRRKTAERTEEAPRKPSRGRKVPEWDDLYGSVELEEDLD